MAPTRENFLTCVIINSNQSHAEAAGNVKLVWFEAFWSDICEIDTIGVDGITDGLPTCGGEWLGTSFDFYHNQLDLTGVFTADISDAHNISATELSSDRLARLEA